MSTSETRERVGGRLEGVYRRHLSMYEDEVETYYSPGAGYYKPEETEREHRQFAICLATTNGEVYDVGDYDTLFELQSISKVFLYGRALEIHGRDKVLDHVGVTPVAEDFNSISVVFDERHNRPYNPMVNPGALVTTDLVEDGKGSDEGLERIMSAIRCYAGNDGLEVDEDAYAGMMKTADRNRAISYLMRSFDIISQDVEENLSLYLKQSAVQVTTRDLAKMAATLANGGTNPMTGEQALDRQYVRDVLSAMHMCGMYNFAGQWAYRVGIPAKSGVAGGIMAVVPGKLGIAVFSPGLDEFGNSVRGIKVCEEISYHRGLHVFATDPEDALLGAAEAQY